MNNYKKKKKIKEGENIVSFQAEVKVGVKDEILHASAPMHIFSVEVCVGHVIS